MSSQAVKVLRGHMTQMTDAQKTAVEAVLQELVTVRTALTVATVAIEQQAPSVLHVRLAANGPTVDEVIRRVL